MTSHGPRFLEPDGPQVLLFGGKGGVGKTTCAAATALRLAAGPARRVLVVSTDPAHSMRDCLGHLPAKMDLLQIDAEAALRAFKRRHEEILRELAVRGTFLADDEIASFLDLSLPGLDELMAFLEISNQLESAQYDRVVIDTAPMGHTLRLLGMFEVITRWFRALDTLLAKHRYMVERFRGEYQPDQVDHFLISLEHSLKKLVNVLRDPRRCQFVPILLPESLSVFQTGRLLEELDRLGVPVHDMVVNRVCPPNACPVCRVEVIRQRPSLDQIRWQFGDRPLWSLPLLGHSLGRADQLALFWDASEPLADGPHVPKSYEASAAQVRVSLPLPSTNVRLLVVAGKGGVGKTTLACATALRLAEVRPSQKIMLFSTDPAHSLSACLDLSIGPHEVRVRPNLTAIEVDAGAEFDALKHRYSDELGLFFNGLSGRSAVGMEFDREALESLLDLSPPGLDEVMALIRIVDLMQSGRHDVFVLDTAPSGHLIRFLGMPRLAQDWLKMIFSVLLRYRTLFRLPRTNELLVATSRGIKALRGLLSDPLNSQMMVVAIPTELSLARTIELVNACRFSGLNVSTLVINQLTPRGTCPLCLDLAKQDADLIDRFHTTFPEFTPACIERGCEPRGLIRLLELGTALYHEVT